METSACAGGRGRAVRCRRAQGSAREKGRRASAACIRRPFLRMQGSAREKGRRASAACIRRLLQRRHARTVGVGLAEGIPQPLVERGDELDRRRRDVGCSAPHALRQDLCRLKAVLGNGALGGGARGGGGLGLSLGGEVHRLRVVIELEAERVELRSRKEIQRGNAPASATILRHQC